MTVSHHLTDETVQDYVVGSLSVPMETLVACHLTVCPNCRQRTDLAERVGGAMLDDTDTVPVHSSAKEVIAKATSTPAQTEATEPLADDLPTGVPRPLARLLPSSIETLRWRRIAPGIKQYNLSKQHRRHGAFKLLHLNPGVVLSQHTHDDRELTYVVRGSYQDEIGCFQAGDIADLDGHDKHQPVVNGAEPCIALIATHSPVRFSSLFGKIMQPFVGI